MSRYTDRFYEERKSSYEDKEHVSPKMEQMEPTPKNGVVKGVPYLRLREAPGEEEKTLRIVDEGTELQVVMEENKFAPEGFTKVKIKGDPIEYWAKKKYIVEIGGDVMNGS